MPPPTQPCATARGVLPMDRGARAVAIGREVLGRCWRAADNYTLVLVLIVLAILVTAATEGTPPARIGALLLLGGGLLFGVSRDTPNFEQ